MLKKIAATITVATLMTNAGFTCTIDGNEGLLPENDLNISVHNKSNLLMNEEIFHQVIDKVTDYYAPIFEQEGAKLVVSKDWEDGTVNAYAQRTGDAWKISMFGGLARHQTITPDGLALVVCHELGHHVGGAPKKESWFGTRWASNEGQADYFATSKCLRRVFRTEDNSAAMQGADVPSVVVTACEEQFTNETDRLICQRNSMAGMSVSKLFQALRNADVDPDFSTPDTNVVSRTNHNHPAYQCRLDTYYQGALCQVNELVDVDQKDETVGVCAQDETMGFRPQCWFAPAL